MHYRVLLLSLLGSTTQVLGAPVLSTPTTSTTVTISGCQQYFGKNDHGDCFGRHCGPQNFPAGETPTHCAGEGSVQKKRHNVCRFIDGKLHCRKLIPQRPKLELKTDKTFHDAAKPVKPTAMIAHVTRAVDSEAASATAKATLAADVLNETVSDMIEFLAKHENVSEVFNLTAKATATNASGEMDLTTMTTTTVPVAPIVAKRALNDIAEQVDLLKISNSAAPIHSTDTPKPVHTTITTTIVLASAAPTATEDLERRHILCERIHGKVLCGSKLRQHYNQHLSEVLSAAESLHRSTTNASFTTTAMATAEGMDTTTTTTVTPTFAAPIMADETGDLEKRRNLCRMVDGKVQCGKKTNHASTNQNTTINVNRTKQHGRSNPTSVNGTALFEKVEKLDKHALAAISVATEAHVNSTAKAVESEIDTLASDLLPAHRLPRSVNEDGDADANVDLAVDTDADDTNGTIEARQYPHALPAIVPTPGRDFLNWKREAATDEQEQCDDDDQPAQSNNLTFPNAPTDGKYPIILESDAPNVLPARLIVTSFDANKPLPTGEALLFEEARHCKIKCDHNVTAGPDCYFDCMVDFKPSQLYEPVFLETVRTDNKIEPRSDIPGDMATAVTDETSDSAELLAVMATDSDKPIPTGGDRFIRQAQYCKQKCDHEISTGNADPTCYKECVTDFNPADLHEPMYFEPATAGKIQARDEDEEDVSGDDIVENDIQTDVVVMSFDPSKPIPTGGDLYIEEAKWCKAKCDDEISSKTATDLCYQDCVNDFDPARLRDPVYYESYADPAGLPMPNNVDEHDTEPEVTSTGP
nr:hypothetical protein CFP56_03924 [Quercus suber]